MPDALKCIRSQEPLPSKALRLATCQHAKATPLPLAQVLPRQRVACGLLVVSGAGLFPVFRCDFPLCPLSPLFFAVKDCFSSPGGGPDCLFFGWVFPGWIAVGASVASIPLDP